MVAYALALALLCTMAVTAGPALRTRHQQLLPFLKVGEQGVVRGRSRLTNGRGVGIRNTRERLQVLYGERGVVDVRNTEPGLRVALTFPAEAARAAA